MKGRSFVLFGVLAVIAAVALFIALQTSTTWSWYWSWLVSAGVVAFVYYALDKAFAKAGTGRIPEMLLHLLALTGGFIGALIGMLAFRHKSNVRSHPLFLPVIIISAVLWGGLIYWLITQSS